MEQKITMNREGLIILFDALMNYYKDFNQAVEAIKLVTVNDNGQLDEVIADMDQKYNKVWKSVTLRAQWYGELVILQVMGERGYEIESVGIKALNTTAESRRKRFQEWLDSFNETYNSNFTLEDITCVNFND